MAPHALIARFKPGDNVPAFTPGAPVEAGHFVKITGPKSDRGDYCIGHCAAADVAFGVAERSTTPDSGEGAHPDHAWTRRTNVVRRGAIARVIAGAAVTAGDGVQSDATGRGITLAAGVRQGTAVNSVTVAGQILEVDLA